MQLMKGVGVFGKIWINLFNHAGPMKNLISTFIFLFSSSFIFAQVPHHVPFAHAFPSPHTSTVVIVKSEPKQRFVYSSDQSTYHRRVFNRLTIQAGGGLNYMFGQLYDAPYDFDAQLLNWQMQGFAGYRLDGRNGCRANVLGIWGTVGFQSESSVNALLKGQELSTLPEAGTSEPHLAQEWEVGIFFKEWFRLSGGVGQLIYEDVNDIERKLDYYTATAGFSVYMGQYVRWVTNGTFLFGQDFEEITFRPSTGIAIQFNFLKI